MIDFRNPDGTKFLDPRAAAFKAIFARLKNDPVLSRVVAKWSGMPFLVPQLTVNELPYMQVTLAAGPIKTATPNSYDTTMAVEISYAVNAAGADETTAWVDLLNLYSQVEKAINSFGEMTWIRDAVIAANPNTVVKSKVSFTSQGFTSIPLTDISAIAGKCTLSLNLKIDTCRG